MVKIRSCMPCLTELSSIRIIVRRVQIREENLYLLLTLLFYIFPNINMQIKIFTLFLLYYFLFS
jgi:ArsR family metal-binding transcriptional regulator